MRTLTVLPLGNVLNDASLSVTVPARVALVLDISAHLVQIRPMNSIRLSTAMTLLCSVAVKALAAGGVALRPIQTAGTDAQGRITVNGKPFFPILMYDTPTDPASLKMFREHGFNTLTAKPEEAETLREHGLYTAVHTGKKVEKLDGVLFGIGMDSPALYWRDDLLGKCRADLAQLREWVPNRPIMHAIGYWEDEPGGVISNKVPAKERYEELVKVLDVSAPYLYPVPYQPVKSVGEAMARADAATNGKKPLLPVLQLFTWDAKDRYPTPAELKCMVYLALIHGADGIGYYSYNYVAGKKGTNIAKEQPELWKAVKEINEEVYMISSWLRDSRPESLVALAKPNPAVEFRAAHSTGSLHLLVVNTSGSKTEAEFRVPVQGTRGIASPAGTRATIDKGILRCSLQAFEAVDWQFDLRDPRSSR